MQKIQHVLSTRQFTDRSLLDHLFMQAHNMERDDAFRTLPQRMRGRVLATVFYEPSTRTRFSFEASMQKLGGGVITSENARESSSAAKGETIEDAIRVIAGYADVIVLRHYLVGMAEAAAKVSPVPIINAGDGAGEHPTQALIDIYTMRKELGHIDGIRVALVGDLKHGRTIHSLLPLLCLYPNVSVDLISPPSLRMPEKYLDFLTERGAKYAEHVELEGVIENADVVYITRVQQERFSSQAEYESIRDVYVLDAMMAERLKQDAIIMHALPRVNEIAPEVDANRRAAYFRQAKNGLYVRMALLDHLLASPYS